MYSPFIKQSINISRPNFIFAHHSTTIVDQEVWKRTSIFNACLHNYNGVQLHVICCGVLWFTLKPNLHFPVRPGASWQFVAGGQGEPGQIVKEFECVHIFPAMLRTKPGLGQNMISICPGYSTVCDGTFLVYPRWRYSVSRCVPKSHGFAPDIGGRAPVLAGVYTASHGSGTAKPRFYTVAYTCK